MAVFSAIAGAVSAAVGAIGGAVGAVGSAVSGIGLGGALGAASAAAGLYGTYQSMRGQSQVADGSRRAEALRLRQMNLQATRERRQTMRQSIISRAQALNAGEAQGAMGSSGLTGGLANVSSQNGTNFQSIGMNQSIGQGMFNANSTISSGQQRASIGQAVQGFGNLITQNREAISRVTGFGAQPLTA